MNKQDLSNEVHPQDILRAAWIPWKSCALNIETGEHGSDETGIGTNAVWNATLKDDKRKRDEERKEGDYGRCEWKLKTGGSVVVNGLLVISIISWSLSLDGIVSRSTWSATTWQYKQPYKIITEHGVLMVDGWCLISDRAVRSPLVYRPALFPARLYASACSLSPLPMQFRSRPPWSSPPDSVAIFHSSKNAPRPTLLINHFPSNIKNFTLEAS